jgi:predicted site-specific integrase-resolvase
MTIKEAADALNVSTKRVYELVKRGVLQPIGVKKTPIQVTVDSVAAYAANRRSVGRPAKP